MSASFLKLLFILFFQFLYSFYYCLYLILFFVGILYFHYSTADSIWLFIYSISYSRFVYIFLEAFPHCLLI